MIIWGRYKGERTMQLSPLVLGYLCLPHFYKEKFNNMKGIQMSKAEKNINKMMQGYGDLFKEMAEIFKSPIVIQQEINRECERLRQAFIENASDYEMRIFANPDCKDCDGAGLYTDHEGTIEEFYPIRVVCDCLGELDDEGMMRYQKDKEEKTNG